MRIILPSVCILFLAAALAYTVAHFVFQQVPLNADENSYLFQAHCFLDGVIARPLPPNPPAFQSGGIIISPEVGWVSRYPFGHPLFLVPGVAMGNPHLWVAMMAACCAFVVMRTGMLLAGCGAGVWATLLLLVSPFFIFYHGTLLSHSSALLAAAIMCWAYIRWQKSAGGIGFAVIAGLAWAFMLNSRTYTALLMAIPFGVDALYALYRDRTVVRLRATTAFALSSLCGVGALLLYNQLSVGDWRVMTYLYYNPTETLGFGPRIYDRYDHTLTRGLGIMLENLRLLDQWLFGFRGSLLLLLALAVAGWTHRWSMFCLSVVACVCLGYVYFYYEGPRDAGPGYYFELLPFWALAGALGIQRIASRFSVVPIIALFALLLFAGVPWSIQEGQRLREFNRVRREIFDVIERLPTQTLLFIDRGQFRQAFAFGNDLIFNPRGLDSDVVIAAWLEDFAKPMAQYFSGHNPVRLVRADSGELSVVPVSTEHVVCMDFPIGSLHRKTGTNVTDPERNGQLVRIAQAQDHAADYLILGRSRYVAPGPYAFEILVKTEVDAADEAVLHIRVIGHYGNLLLASHAVQHVDDWHTVRLEFDVPGLMMVEPRVWYTGIGTARIASVRLEEVQEGNRSHCIGALSGLIQGNAEAASEADR